VTDGLEVKSVGGVKERLKTSLLGEALLLDGDGERKTRSEGGSEEGGVYIAPGTDGGPCAPALRLRRRPAANLAASPRSRSCSSAAATSNRASCWRILPALLVRTCLAVHLRPITAAAAQIKPPTPAPPGV
jgi:hypothetical protein